MACIRIKSIYNGNLKIREEADVASREIGSLSFHEEVEADLVPVIANDNVTAFYHIIHGGYVLAMHVREVGERDIEDAIAKATTATTKATAAADRCNLIADGKNILTDEETGQTAKLSLNKGNLIVREV